MLTIHKYTFEPSGEITLRMPKGAQVLSFQNQNDTPTIWAMANSEAEKVDINFMIFGTGHKIPDEPHLLYIGTAQFYNGRLVWHLFKRT